MNGTQQGFGWRRVLHNWMTSCVHITVSLRPTPKIQERMFMDPHFLQYKFPEDFWWFLSLSHFLLVSFVRFLTSSSISLRHSFLISKYLCYVSKNWTIANFCFLNSHIKSLFPPVWMPLTIRGEVTYKERKKALRLTFKLQERVRDPVNECVVGDTFGLDLAGHADVDVSEYQFL